MKKLTLANALTGFRLLGAIALIFAQPLSTLFYVLYVLCGVSDALDGPAARHSGTQSEFGARLDSAADITFYSVLVLRLLPVLKEIVPRWMWGWGVGVLGLRVLGYILAAVKFRRFASLHTWLNKGTSILFFFGPCLIKAPAFPTYLIVLASVASLAAVEELAIHLRNKEYRTDCHSLWRAFH